MLTFGSVANSIVQTFPFFRPSIWTGKKKRKTRRRRKRSEKRSEKREQGVSFFRSCSFFASFFPSFFSAGSLPLWNSACAHS
ncbi:hypothetical protein K474DRAFT_635467 [Panus rudis PR-1116 ss-1]|nr:hypothetical protein K474DRAFT_635467 [Panus rudis PR-1116 ss-1]